MVAMVVAFPARVTVGCGRGKELVGLTAQRRTIGMPERGWPIRTC